MLADFETTIRINQRRRQLGMTIEEKAVGNEHQVGVGPTLAGQSQVLDQMRVQERLAAEQGEAARSNALRPQ